MSFLKDILTLTEATDESALTELQMKDIQSNIGKGAKDLEQDWANALELVHRAYLVSKIERPTPAMKAAWKQYETNLQYAVQQLAKARGMDGDWRMSAASLHEAMEAQREFKIHLKLPDQEANTVIQADDLDHAIKLLRHQLKRRMKTQNVEDMTIKVEDTFKGKKLTFWSQGSIRNNSFISIEPN